MTEPAVVGHQETCSLLDLPQPVLVHMLSYLDVVNLCNAARTCQQLHALASSDSLWPHAPQDGPLTRCAKAALASVLHLPPQVSYAVGCVLLKEHAFLLLLKSTPYAAFLALATGN